MDFILLCNFSMQIDPVLTQTSCSLWEDNGKVNITYEEKTCSKIFFKKSFDWKLQEQHIFSKGPQVVSKNIMNVVRNHMIILEPCVLH